MNDSVLLADKSGTYRIFLNNIMYVTTAKTHYLKVITYEGVYYTQGTLTEWEANYPTFSRCHRNTVVNLKVISKIDKVSREITFLTINGKTLTCAISRRQYPKLVEEWATYFDAK